MNVLIGCKSLSKHGWNWKPLTDCLTSDKRVHRGTLPALEDAKCRDRLLKQFPCLHPQFKEGFKFDSFENLITTPFDILNINEIKLDGEATLHSFNVLNHIFTEMNPTAETELYRILQLASAKLLKDDEFMDECSVSIVRNPSAALKPCFRRYEDKVYRICGL